MRRDSCRVTALAFWIAMLAIGWTAHAAAEPAPIITHHQIEIGGRALAYTAEAGRTAIRDVETGEPVGDIFYVAYRSAPRPGKIRPIMFIWNGGPGMPAAILHFEGAGPKRIAGGPSSRQRRYVAHRFRAWCSWIPLERVSPAP